VATRLEALAGFRRWWMGGGSQQRAVTPGEVYAHEAVGRTVELAQVTDTATDEFGIRHIHFRLYYRYQYKIMEAGERTLAIEAFTGRFTRRLEPGEYGEYHAPDED
jgi:hypothetical protein